MAAAAERNALVRIGLREFQPFQGGPGHEPCLAKDKPDNGLLQFGGIHRTACSYDEQGNGAVNANLPTVAVPELLERCLIHEAEDDVRFLRANLEPARDSGHVVVTDALSTDPEGSIAVLRPHYKAGLHDSRHDEYALRGLEEFIGPLYVLGETLKPG